MSRKKISNIKLKMNFDSEALKKTAAAAERLEKVFSECAASIDIAKAGRDFTGITVGTMGGQNKFDVYRDVLKSPYTDKEETEWAKSARLGEEYILRENKTEKKPLTVIEIKGVIKGVSTNPKYKTGDTVYVLDPHPKELLVEGLAFDFKRVMSWISNIKVKKMTICMVMENANMLDENGRCLPGYRCTEDGGINGRYQVYEQYMSQTRQEAVESGIKVLQQARDRLNRGIEELYKQEGYTDDRK